MEQDARAAQEVETRHRHMMNIVEQSGQAIATAGVGLVAAGVVGVAAIKNLVDVSVEYERQVRHTATQVSNFNGDLQALGDIGRRAAHDFAVPFEQIQPALFDIFSSTEANAQQAEMMLRAFAKAAVAGQVDIQDTSRATMGILNAFSLPLEDVNRILDIQFQLVKEGVGDYSEWAEKIGLVSPSAARAGQTVEMMAAALATATRMGMTAARASTSVARAMDAMSNPKTIANLEKLGVKSRDAAGHMRPLNEVLRDFRAALMKLPEKDRVGALLDVFKGSGGTIEARRFLQTMLLVPGTLEQFDQILGEVKNSTGALDQAYSTMADSAAAKTQLLHNKWMLLKEGLGKALEPALVRGIDLVNRFLDRFDNMSDHSKRVAAMLMVAGTAIALVGGIILVVVGGLAAFIAAVSAAGEVLLPVIAIVVGVVVGLAALAAAFKAAYDRSTPFRTMMSSWTDDAKRLWDVLVGFARDVKNSFDKDLAPAFGKVSGYLNDTIIPAFNTFRMHMANELLPAIKDVLGWVQKMADTGFKYLSDGINNWLLPAIKYLTQAWIDHRAEIQPVIDILIQIVKWIGIAAAVVVGVLAIALGSVLMAAIVAVIAIIGFLIKVVAKCINWWHDTADAIRGVGAVMSWLVDSSRKAVSDLLEQVKGIPHKVKDAVGNLGNLLLNAGTSLVQGLIEGIEAKLPALWAELAKVTAAIAAHKGPPSRDRRLLVPAGLSIMGGLIKGIQQAMPALVKQIDEVNKQFVVTGDAGSGSGGGGDSTFRKPDLGPTPPPSGGVTKNYYITQNITTQEISPVRQAADLGWEVQTVM